MTEHGRNERKRGVSGPPPKPSLQRTLFASEGVGFRAPCHVRESLGARAKGRGGAYLSRAAPTPPFTRRSGVARTPGPRAEGEPARHVLSTGAPTGGALTGSAHAASGGGMLPHPSAPSSAHPSSYASTHEGGRCQ